MPTASRARTGGNFNDFIIMEIEFKNTGERDMNMDGTSLTRPLPEPDIKALALIMSGEAYMSIASYLGGGRNQPI